MPDVAGFLLTGFLFSIMQVEESSAWQAPVIAKAFFNTATPACFYASPNGRLEAFQEVEIDWHR